MPPNKPLLIIVKYPPYHEFFDHQISLFYQTTRTFSGVGIHKNRQNNTLKKTNEKQLETFGTDGASVECDYAGY